MVARSAASRGIDALAVIEEEALAVARCFGVPVETEMAAALVERVAFRLGGREVYVGGARIARERVYAEMRRRFTGANIPELAEVFGKSQRQVRRIVMR